MERLRKAGIHAKGRTQLLLTAAEAYPALEAAFLDSRKEIHASFRIFDLDTELRSARARVIGRRWFDLIVDTLRRGVALHFTLADFDPCARPKLHRLTWQSLRQFHAAAELAGPQAKLHARAAMHPAETGILPRLAFWPLALHRLRKQAAEMNGWPADERAAALRDMPGLLPYVEVAPDGHISVPLTRLPRLRPATHHQKLAVFDRKKLYIGGLDLNDRRYDTPRHDRPGDETWQDVQLMMEGPVVAEAQHHLESFEDICAGRAMPLPPRRLLRTLSARRGNPVFHIGPKTITNEIESAHGMLARRSKRLIYLETQYFRSRDLARTLATIGRENPQLSLILILPAAPDEIAFDASDDMDARMGEHLQARALKILRKGFGSRLFIGGAAQPRRPKPGEAENGRDTLAGAPLVYIHAKVSIFDDDAAIVSSANLNGRSLRWDTEAGVYLRRNDGIAELRKRIFGHWLPADASDAFFDPVRAVSAWRELALSNLRCAPEGRRGFILPYDTKEAEAFGSPAPGIPDEMV